MKRPGITNIRILCSVCGEPIPEENEADMGMQCSKSCNAENRLVPGNPDEVKFQLQLQAPLEMLVMKFDINKDEIKNPEEFRELLASFAKQGADE
jgi:hypothetical protein